MEAFKVKVLELRGSTYEIGRQQGEQLNRKHMRWMEDMLTEEIDVNEATAVFKAFAPHLLEEMEGLADALELPIEKAMRYFSGYGLPKLETMGCSSVVTKEYIVRNYDLSPIIYDHQLVFSQPEEAFASVGYSLHQLGRHESVNEHGVAIALHFVNNAHQVTGLISTTITRMMADMCKTTDDCIQLLKELPHACSYNYSIGDSSGHHVVVEASPTKVEVRSAETPISCTNHFQAPHMNEFNRERLGSSLDRKEAIETKKADGEELFNWFSDSTSPMFYEDYEMLFGTLHTFAYFFEEDRFITKVANGTETMDLKFSDWVNGKTNLAGELKGSLNMKRSV
ncbi:C45 family peptidase [Pseudalkalibacillus sp. SCS-8]|uniref:C45 family peptidase n=1 Tax=Pseudalkalibacillus nanhaiensis TaxID=3115291 RepID=UPI0032D9F40B